MCRRLVVLCGLLFILRSLIAQRVTYINLEHPKVTYVNTKYATYANLTSRRHSRADPFYYVDLNFYAVYYFGDNITVSFIFLEFLSNTYRRSFVEMHFTVCNLLKKDKFFGQTLSQGKFLQPCPFPSGQYDLYNMTIPIGQIPKNFPFTKGRININVTATATKEVVGTAYLDMEVKEINVKRLKKT